MQILQTEKLRPKSLKKMGMRVKSTTRHVFAAFKQRKYPN